MAIHLGRDKEFKEIYDHLTAAREIIYEMKKRDSYEASQFRNMVEKLDSFRKEFDERAVSNEKPIWQVWDKFVQLYRTNAHYKEMHEALKEIENVAFFNGSDFNNVVKKYFNGDFLFIVNKIDGKTMEYIKGCTESPKCDKLFCLRLDTMEIRYVRSKFDAIEKKEEFCKKFITNAKLAPLLGYKPNTLERLKREVFLYPGNMGNGGSK